MLSLDPIQISCIACRLQGNNRLSRNPPGRRLWCGSAVPAETECPTSLPRHDDCVHRLDAREPSGGVSRRLAEPAGHSHKVATEECHCTAKSRLSSSPLLATSIIILVLMGSALQPGFRWRLRSLRRLHRLRLPHRSMSGRPAPYCLYNWSVRLEMNST